MITFIGMTLVYDHPWTLFRILEREGVDLTKMKRKKADRIGSSSQLLRNGGKSTSMNFFSLRSVNAIRFSVSKSAGDGSIITGRKQYSGRPAKFTVSSIEIVASPCRDGSQFLV